jgi:metal-responsive CopG/Arc/MetJ family transcriptional regulator
MKTAVSVQDDVFQKAERLARRMKKSRSRLFTEALREYVARHTPDEVKDAMNATLDKVGEEPDRFVSSAARRVLERTEW